MFALQRLDRIKEILLEKERVDVQSLSKTLDVSDVTIRKDLEKLRKEGFIIKTHGGAMLAKSDSKKKTDQVKFETDHLPLKKLIARKAYEQIEKGDSIFIGSGVTCFLLAQMVRKEDKLSVVTNNVSAAPYLKQNAQNVILIGGEISSHENLLFTSSEKVEEYFRNIFVNKAFTSATAVDFECGITVTRELSTFIYKEIKSITKKWYLMAESMKYDRVAMYQVAKVNDPDVFITNEMIPKYDAFFKEENKEIVLA